MPAVPSRFRLSPSALIGCVCLAAFLAFAPSPGAAQTPDIRIVTDASGSRLQVDGEDVFVKGVNWDYFPIGTTTTYNFWAQSDDFIRQALDREMSLLQAMGGNAIRVYNGIPARWVRYIYETYGIWSIVNHAVGRYGVTLSGTYIPNTDYSAPRQRELIKNEVLAMVDELEGTPGLLMWLLGNENNYGLEWSSAETENLPEGEQQAAKARYLYSLFGEVVQEIKARGSAHPVAMANGDLQYLEIIAEEVTGLDVFGSNVYRGISFRDFFEEVEETLGLPVMFTEFGADAFNARTLEEDQVTQARYLIQQWREIYENAAGNGRVGNSIGGLTFQWSDGWWKFGQDQRLDIQDTNASWANDAYPEDYVAGENNMNEEWWGIMAKGPTNALGFYDLYPRAAYYALQEVNALDPYGPGVDRAAIERHFAGIQASEAALAARGDKAALESSLSSLARFAGLRMELETYSTGGDLTRTPDDPMEGSTVRPSFQGFDTKQSFYADFVSRPAPNVQANLSVNIVGNVPDNPIDELFYESPARVRTVTADGEEVSTQFDRVRVYSAAVSWDERLFRLDGFYRAGHYHWGYQGDFFNFYREANYGPNIDIYNGVAPVGAELTGKKALEGLSLAFGPELWWGANPALLAKYQREIGGLTVTALFQEDFERKETVTSSFAIPVPEDRRASLSVAAPLGPVGVELGGIWAGSPQVGRTFQVVTGEPGDYEVLQDDVKDSDTFGGKVKLTLSRGRVNWYAVGSAMGLVANGGYDQTQTYTGWRLKDNGSGNQWQILSGFTLNAGGNLQVAPNFMWQKPIVGPVPGDAPPPARPRNILDDPFAVRVNRETTAAEILFTWDPTPATWMYAWDSDVLEDAPFAVSAGFVWRRHHTTADAAIGILGDGRTTFAFPGATPARDLWELHARVVSKRSEGVNLILNGFYGTGEPNGDDPRRITRYGGDFRVVSGPVKFAGFAKFNDWGPYDYHRDFNLTFPTQLMGDISYSFGLPDWLNVPQTKFGVRGMWRTLDQFSPRFCPDRVPDEFGSLTCDPNAPGENGREWEIRTYLHFVL